MGVKDSVGSLFFFHVKLNVSETSHFYITDCDYSLGVASGGITTVNITSSSDYDEEHTAVSARLGVIPEVGLQGSGWIPADGDSDPWLRVHMPGVYTIQSISTQGCGDQFAWIAEYCISTPDGMDGFDFYGGASLEDCKVII